MMDTVFVNIKGGAPVRRQVGGQTRVQSPWREIT